MPPTHDQRAREAEARIASRAISTVRFDPRSRAGRRARPWRCISGANGGRQPEHHDEHPRPRPCIQQRAWCRQPRPRPARSRLETDEAGPTANNRVISSARAFEEPLSSARGEPIMENRRKSWQLQRSSDSMPGQQARRRRPGETPPPASVGRHAELRRQDQADHDRVAKAERDCSEASLRAGLVHRAVRGAPAVQQLCPRGGMTTARRADARPRSRSKTTRARDAGAKPSAGLNARVTIHDQLRGARGAGELHHQPQAREGPLIRGARRRPVRVRREPERRRSRSPNHTLIARKARRRGRGARRVFGARPLRSSENRQGRQARHG